MAKLGLIFIAIFCFVQIALCGRIQRDAPTKDDVQSTADQIQEQLKNIFSEKTWNEIVESASRFGSEIAKTGKEFLDKVQDKTATAPTNAS
uniref:Putative salivary secreted peptide n=1 Tax=Lutzomyia longipalpis TaxID=7200 RepID=A0A7G3AX38_LUTLO